MNSRLDSRITMLLVVAFTIIWTNHAYAANTWEATVDNAWTNALNWSDGNVPVNGDDVLIPVTGTDPVMEAGIYPVSGAFGSFQVQDDVIVTCLGNTNSVNGGTVESPYGSGVSIFSQSALINGTLNADYQGFPGLKGPGYAGCGSHGGRGGGSTGITYGSLKQPTSLGSGGGISSLAGGGAIRLSVTNTLTLNGSITANGKGNRSGAAGGSILLEADIFEGDGDISAKGGNRGANPGEPGGGGGRVSIVYEASTFTGNVLVNGGYGCGVTYGYSHGQAGTLWEPKRFADAIGTSSNPTNITISGGYQYFFSNTVMRYWNLIITDGAWFEVHDGAMTINNLTLSAGTFNFDRYADNRRAEPSMDSMSITGNVYLSGNSDLFYCQAVTVSAVSTCWTVRVFAMGDTNAINGGTVENPYGAGVTIECQGATIEGSINAVSMGRAGFGFGFPPKTGPGAVGTTSASYGGRAGYDTTDKTYGSLTEPDALGSGGYYASGAGAIKLNVHETLALDGAINAAGLVQGINYSGGQSGGSVWIAADTLTGGGTIEASGSFRGSNPSWPGGGGGRAAIYYTASTFTGTVTVAGGKGAVAPYTPGDAKTGTVFWCETATPHGGEAGGSSITLSSSFDVNSQTNSYTNGIVVARTISKWKTSTPLLTWTDQSHDGQMTQIDSVATYTIAGLQPDGTIFVDDNDMRLDTMYADSSGTLTLTLALDNGSHTIKLSVLPPGSVIIIR